MKESPPLQPLCNKIAWNLKLKAGMTSFGYVKVERKFLVDRIWHEISYADIHHLNKSWANEVTTNTNQIFLSTFSSGKSIHVAIDNSDGKQQTITGSKTTHYTNGVAFQLHTSNPTEIISTQNIEKTECGVF